jgi:uncharacterized protein (DUF305 family)
MHSPSQVFAIPLEGNVLPMNRSAVLRCVPVIIATAVGAAVLSGCGGQSTDAATPAGGMAGMSTSSSAETAASNEADVSFAQMMISDHQMMDTMGKLAEKKAVSDDLKTLAPQLREGQAETVSTLQGMLADWGKPASADMAGMEMPGVMTDADMSMLKSMKGMDFDMMFAQMMVKHHEASIKMARDEQANGASTEAKAMAAEMLTQQQARLDDLLKIAQM